MEWIPAPTEDLNEFLSRSTRLVLIDAPEFHIAMPEIITVAPGRTILFPEVGVDFRTVDPTGHTSVCTPAALTKDGLVARLDFSGNETGTVTIPAYNRFSTYFLGSSSDITIDFFTWFGDPAAGQKTQRRTIPVLVLLLDDWKVTRKAAYGETALLWGKIAMYGAPDPNAVKVLKKEAGKVYEAARDYRDRWTALGIKDFYLEPAKYSYCNPNDRGDVLEALMPFQCLVKLH